MTAVGSPATLSSVLELAMRTMGSNRNRETPKRPPATGWLRRSRKRVASEAPAAVAPLRWSFYGPVDVCRWLTPSFTESLDDGRKLRPSSTK